MARNACFREPRLFSSFPESGRSRGTGRLMHRTHPVRPQMAPCQGGLARAAIRHVLSCRTAVPLEPPGTNGIRRS